MGFDPFSMLSSLVGGGLGFLVGGPMGAAVGSGLGTAAYTGDLGKGIASGIMSYGLGNAVGGLADFGSEAASGVAGSAATDAATWAGQDAVGDLISKNAIPEAALNQPAGMFDNIPKAFNNLGTPGALKSVFLDNALKTSVPIGLGAFGMMGGMDSGGGQQQAYGRPQYSATTQGTGRRYLGPGMPDQRGYERTYFGYQAGGKVDPKRKPKTPLSVPPKETVFKVDDPAFDPKVFEGNNDTIKYDLYGNAIISPNLGERWGNYQDQRRQQSRTDDWYRAPSRRYYGPDAQFQFDGGGPVSGPGGGLDDAIPAMINQRQPAALSSGEYVVPAHAVSGLGDGSTEEGVRKLDAMVDGVMQHKFGTKDRKPRPMSAMKGSKRARPFARGGEVQGLADLLQAYSLLREEPMGASQFYLPQAPSGLMSQAPVEVTQEREDPDLASARDRISRLESGGNYKALGPMVGKDRAYGRYQVMGANIPSWTQAALGRTLTPEEFLADTRAQDAVFNDRFGGYMKKYGAKGAARAWFAGEGGMNNRRAKDVLGTSVEDYERRFAG